MTATVATTTTHDATGRCAAHHAPTTEHAPTVHAADVEGSA